MDTMVYECFDADTYTLMQPDELQLGSCWVATAKAMSLCSTPHPTLSQIQHCIAVTGNRPPQAQADDPTLHKHAHAHAQACAHIKPTH